MPRNVPLSREVIVSAALDLAERDGLDRLTMRALASQLGVTPMAIYYHVPDKEALVDLVVDEVHTRQVPLELTDEGWEVCLRRRLLAQWEQLVRYPGLGSHLSNQPGMGASQQSIEAGVAFFEAAGFTNRSARLAWSFAITYLHGRLNVDARMRGRSSSGKVAGIKAKDYVAFGVDAVIAGIAAVAETDAEGDDLGDRGDLVAEA
jgi:TetR/AcrR family tetracycline transcriptional repressor